MGIYEQLAAEHAERERAQRERAQQIAAMAAREAAMREAAQREAAQREAVMRAQQTQAQQAQAPQARLTQAQRAAAQQAQAARAGQTAAARAGQYPRYQDPRYQQSPTPVPGQNFAPRQSPGPVPGQIFAPRQSPGPTAPGYNPAAPAAPVPGYPVAPAPGHPAQFAPPAPQSAARTQSAPKGGRLRSKLFGGKRRERTADANQLANRVVGNVANGAQPPLMAPSAPQQRAPQQKAPQQGAPQPPAPQPASRSARPQPALPQPAPSRPAHSRPLSPTAANIPAPAQAQIQAATPAAPSGAAPAQSQAPLPAAPAAAAPARTDAPASAIKRFKSLAIKRTPKPKAPIPAPADKNTEHNLAHYKSLPTVGPENVDALHLMAVGTSIWALAAVGLSILLGATASRAAALEICLCGIVIGVIGMAWGGVHEYRKALGRGPLSEDNSTPIDDVAAGEALSLRYRDI